MIHIEGKVVDIMPETSGVGKSGRQWRERAVSEERSSGIQGRGCRYGEHAACRRRGEL